MRSMTGYGTGVAKKGRWIFETEIKSVNHRNLSLNIYFPGEYSALDPLVRSLVKERIARGRVDLNINVVVEEGEVPEISLDTSLLQAYNQAIIQAVGKGMVSEEFKLSLPGVLRQKKTPELEEVKEVLQESIKQALEQLIFMQEREGETLKKEIEEYAKKIAEMVQSIKGILPEIQKEHYHKLKSKLESFLEENDFAEERIMMEAGVLAERSDIQEEIVRLESHLEHLSGALREKNAVGKKLDFIAQEMLREINTIGSKINNREVLYRVIELKSWVEKIREQVQNIL